MYREQTHQLTGLTIGLLIGVNNFETRLDWGATDEGMEEGTGVGAQPSLSLVLCRVGPLIILGLVGTDPAEGPRSY